jgi:hypothetical protein
MESLTFAAIGRGSPSLVGRGIANPMFVRTRGFKSHSPRFYLAPTEKHEFYAFLECIYCIDYRYIKLV